MTTATEFARRGPLSWRIESVGLTPFVIWSNGARRPAGELELELWREREQLLAFIERWASASFGMYTLVAGRNPAGMPTFEPPTMDVPAPPPSPQTPPASAVPKTGATTAASKPEEAAGDDDPFDEVEGGSDASEPSQTVAVSSPTPAPGSNQAALAAQLKAKHRDKLLAQRRERQSAGGLPLGATPAK